MGILICLGVSEDQENLNMSKKVAVIVILLVLFLGAIFFYNHYSLDNVGYESMTDTGDDTIPSSPSEYIPTDYTRYDVFHDRDILGLVAVSPEKGLETGIAEYPLLTWQTYKILEERGRVGIDIEYPHFFNNDSNKVVKLNEYIENYIEGVIEEDRKSLKKMLKDVDGIDSFLSIISLSSVYRLIGVTNGIVSLEMVVTDFTGGGNGNHDGPVTINWDLKSNRPLTMDQVFCSKDYRELLTPLVRKQIISNFEQSPYISQPLGKDIIDWIQNGTTADTDNWQYFLLKDDGIIAVFPPYQITSGASGIVRAYIPNSLIPNLLCLP